MLKYNPEKIRLDRVLETLSGFELLIMGYSSYVTFLDTYGYIKNKLKEKEIKNVEINLSKIGYHTEFKDIFIKKNKIKSPYKVFNLTNIEYYKNNIILLKQLNLYREFMADYNNAIFFWCPEIYIEEITIHAPDLWSWRDTCIIF